MRNNVEDGSSWLCNPFVDGRVYGTKFSIEDDYFSWKFFLRAESPEQAIQDGFLFLDFLKEVYPGLSGNVKVKPIDFKQLNKQKLLFELLLPKPSFHKKINLIRKIVNLFTYNKQHIIKIYILWQRDDSIIGEIKGTELEKEYKLDDNFKVKIFISLIPNFENDRNIKIQKAELKGHLQYLTSDIKNIDGEGATLKQVPKDIWEEILTGRVFWKNVQGVDTGRFYSGIKDLIPEDRIPGFINPEAIDFNIPEYFLLNKAINVHNENVSFSHRINEKELLLGYYNSRGAITHKKITLSINDLVHHLFICGKSGSGKTSLLNHLQYEISIKGEDCGVLIISLKKEKEDIKYNLDINLKYGDPDFRVPYFFMGKNIEVTLEQFAALLSSSLGLKQPVDIAMYNSILKYFEKNQNVPDTLEKLFGKLLNWFEKHRYHIKYHTNIINAIKNRALRWVSSPTLDKITRLPSIKPFWFIEWMNGKNVFIDLSQSRCNGFIKKLLVNLIFQMIRIFFPQTRTNTLKNVIMIDEIDDIAKKPATTSSNDDKFISQYFLEEVLSEFLEAFRSRGISLILTAHMASQLFESIYSLPSICILFRIPQSCSKLFTNNIEEQDNLAVLGNRNALVIDGANGRRFGIYTIDFKYEKLTNHTINRIENVCPLCKNSIQTYDNFCSSCENSLNSDTNLLVDKSDKETSKLKEKD